MNETIYFSGRKETHSLPLRGNCPQLDSLCNIFFVLLSHQFIRDGNIEFGKQRFNVRLRVVARVMTM